MILNVTLINEQIRVKLNLLLSSYMIHLQADATREKLILEDEQRRVHKELAEKEEDWVPKHFELDPDSSSTHAWVYKYKE